MRDPRTGQALWSIWSGKDYEPATNPDFIFGTVTHVDLENEIVRRGLASAIQREGLVFTLGNGFKSIDSATIVQGYAGYVDGDDELSKCDENGETKYGDAVEAAVPYTWVELK